MLFFFFFPGERESKRETKRKRKKVKEKYGTMKRMKERVSRKKWKAKERK